MKRTVDEKMAANIRAKVTAKVKEKFEARRRGEYETRKEKDAKQKAIAGALLGGGNNK